MKKLITVAVAVAAVVGALIFIGWYADDAGWMEDRDPQS